MARAFSARSVVASVLLGTIPPRLSSRRLVSLTTEFGIAEGTTRVALSRMVERGELTNDGGVYELAGSLLERQERQESGLAPVTKEWDGAWEMFVIRAGGRDSHDRSSLRKSFVHLHLAERRDGVWLRPDNLDPDRLAGDREIVDGQAERYIARPDSSARELAATVFDLGGWAASAEQLESTMATTIDALRRGDQSILATGFTHAADVVRHLVSDPLLPVELHPAEWPADRLRSSYRAYNDAYRALLADFFAA